MSLTKMIEKFSGKYSHKIQRLCNPLHEKLGINSFFYKTISQDGSMTLLASRVDTALAFAEAQLDRSSPFNADPAHLEPGIYPTAMVVKQSDSFQEIINLNHRYNSVPVLNIIKRNNNELIECGFGVSTNSQEMELRIMNEVPLLRKFIKYFNEEMKDISNELQGSAVSLVDLVGPKFHQKRLSANIGLESSDRMSLFEQFGYANDGVCEQTKLLMTEIFSQGGLIPISKREEDCVKLMLLGFSSREIGETLHLSSRTVEHYLENVKNKVNASTKSELRNYFIKFDPSEIL